MHEPAEHHLAVTRTARYWSLGGPDTALRELWIVCHGYGQLAERFLRRFQPIAADDRWIVAPEALNRFYLDGRIGRHGPDSAVGATWMTREDRLHDIDDYIMLLDTLHDHLSARLDADTAVVVLGFSQGVATVARWAAKTRKRIDHLVLWAGGLPPELEPAADLFGDATLTLVAGRDDRMVGTAAMTGLGERLAAAGLAASLLQHDGGHDIPDVAIVAVAESVRDNRGL